MPKKYETFLYKKVCFFNFGLKNEFFVQKLSFAQALKIKNVLLTRRPL